MDTTCKLPWTQFDAPRGEKTTVIIVNFNGGDMILRCLAALAAQDYPDFATLVVDNGSTDGSPERIAAAFPAVHLLRAPGNLGFAGGNAYALRHCADSDWIALLNPDAYPEPGWLSALMAAARTETGYAAFAATLLAADDPQRLDGMGDAYHFSGLCRRIGHGRPLASRSLARREVFAPCAAAALYRASALRAVGGFDVDFFCYCEDVDLGFRLRLAGYRTLYVPEAVAMHAGSGIVGRHSDFQIYHGHRNQVWVFVKNVPGPLFWLLLPAHLGLNLASLAWFTLRGQGRIILQAKLDAFKGLPRAWRKRREIQATRCTPWLDLARSMSWNLLSFFS